jgi:hypothetical protein
LSSAHLHFVPLVGEVSTILTIPAIQARVEPESHVVEPTFSIAVNASIPRELTRNPVRIDKPATVSPASQGTAESDVVASNPPAAATETMVISDARSFHSVATSPTLNSHAQAASGPNGWQVAGTSIGKVARDASVSLAGSFSKAGVSLAKSF